FIISICLKQSKRRKPFVTARYRQVLTCQGACWSSPHTPVCTTDAAETTGEYLREYRASSPRNRWQSSPSPPLPEADGRPNRSNPTAREPASDNAHIRTAGGVPVILGPKCFFQIS